MTTNPTTNQITPIMENRNSSYLTRARIETLFASILTLAIGSTVFGIILYAIIYGNNSANEIGKILGLAGLSLLAIWLLFFSAFFYQPNMTIYPNSFKRTGYPRFSRRIVKFDEIRQFSEIQNDLGKTSLAFSLTDGYRFFIPTDQIDSEFKIIFIKRLNQVGIKMQDTIRVKEFPDYIYKCKDDIQEIEKNLLDKARNGEYEKNL